jgi:hypothetical protein
VRWFFIPYSNREPFDDFCSLDDIDLSAEAKLEFIKSHSDLYKILLEKFGSVSVQAICND